MPSLCKGLDHLVVYVLQGVADIDIRIISIPVGASELHIAAKVDLEGFMILFAFAVVICGRYLIFLFLYFLDEAAFEGVAYGLGRCQKIALQFGENRVSMVIPQFWLEGYFTEMGSGPAEVFYDEGLIGIVWQCVVVDGHIGPFSFFGDLSCLPCSLGADSGVNYKGYGRDGNGQDGGEYLNSWNECFNIHVCVSPISSIEFQYMFIYCSHLLRLYGNILDEFTASNKSLWKIHLKL